MNDPIDRPPHYDHAIQPIDAIEAWGLGFALGNVIKYVVRAGKKDPAREVEDLKKARWYLDHAVKQLEG